MTVVAHAVERDGAAADDSKVPQHHPYWAAALACQSLYLHDTGDPRSAEPGQIVAKIANETSDRQAFAWSSIAAGFAQQSAGEHDAALATLERSCELLASIPDPRLLAHARGMRCMSLMKLGRIEEALDSAERACELIRRNSLTGDLCTQSWLSHAEVRLAILESANPGSATAARRAASKAVKAMLRQGRNVRDSGAAEAHRVAGTFEWLRGKQDKALAQWEQGLSEAQALGAPRAWARLLFERGRRTGSKPDLYEAAALFEKIGATGELQDVATIRQLAT
jgi:tetratricopeptide (TPR) repeat protein